MELRRLGLEALHQILPGAPSSSVGKQYLEYSAASAGPFQPRLAVRPFLARRPSQSSPARVSAGGGLSPENLRLCISTLQVGQFGRQADTIIALTAAESLFWGVSDAIQAKRHEADHEPAYSVLWVRLLREILRLCDDPRLRWARFHSEGNTGPALQRFVCVSHEGTVLSGME
jgi:hypothetical protein